MSTIAVPNNEKVPQLLGYSAVSTSAQTMMTQAKLLICNE